MGHRNEVFFMMLVTLACVTRRYLSDSKSVITYSKSVSHKRHLRHLIPRLLLSSCWISWNNQQPKNERFWFVFLFISSFYTSQWFHWKSHSIPNKSEHRRNFFLAGWIWKDLLRVELIKVSKKLSLHQKAPWPMQPAGVTKQQLPCGIIRAGK